MLVSLAVAATVLASPFPGPGASPLPKGAVFQVIDLDEGPAAASGRPASRAEVSPTDTVLGGFLGQFAVVKPHRSRKDDAPTLQMFVLVAPMKGQVGVHVVGSF